MSKIITITETSTFAKIRQKALMKKFTVGPVSLKFITIIIITFLALFYLTQSQISNSKNYAVKSLNDQKAELDTINDSLKVKAASLKSIANIKSTAEALQMVPSDNINIIKDK